MYFIIYSQGLMTMPTDFKLSSARPYWTGTCKRSKSKEVVALKKYLVDGDIVVH